MTHRLHPTWFLALTLLAGACESPDPATTTWVSRPLAEDVAAAMGQSTPYETIGDVMRPVIPVDWTIYALREESRVTIRATPEATVVSLLCPPELRGRPAVLVAHSAPMGGTLDKRPFHCPADAGVPTEIAMDARHDPQAMVMFVTVGEMTPIETAPVEVPRGARLRVALGRSRAGPGASNAPAMFRVRARAADGRTETVLERGLDPTVQEHQGAWETVDVDLGALRSRLATKVRFVFEASVGGTDHVVLPTFGDPTILSPLPPAKTRSAPLNVVLISIDTLRADQVGSYGATLPTTPVLDRLAVRSTLFEKVIAQAPWTLPAHASMMTGLYPCQHGLDKYTTGKAFPPGVVPLAEHLRKAGYTTAAVTEDGYVDAAAFRRGFSFYAENRKGPPDRVQETVAAAMQWLRDERTSPFFLFVHTYQPHDYYAPPDIARLFPPLDATAMTPFPIDRGTLARYQGAIRYTDTALAPLLETIQAPPLRERTLLVVTSDHGEGFGERGYKGHAWSLHEEIMRVPLLVAGPSIAAGRRIREVVGLLDVAPTILDLIGLPVPVEMQGVSLAPQVRGDTTAAPSARILFSESSFQGYQMAVHTARWKVHFKGPQGLAFDLVQDPLELSRRGAPDILPRAWAARAEFERRCADVKAALAAAGRDVPPPPPAPVDPDQQRRLRALGYLE